MGKKPATKKRSVGQQPLAAQPRSFMDYVTGTSRMTRDNSSTQPSVLDKFKTGANNLKGLVGALPKANPFEFDNTVAQQAKNISTKNRSMKKRKGAKSESKSEQAKDKAMGIKEGGPKDLAMDEKSRKHRGMIKKSGAFKGKSNKLGFGGRAAQMKAKGVPGGVIGAIARKEGAAPGGPNYHGSKKRSIKKRGIGNAVAKATGWPKGVNNVSLNKSGTVGTEPISKGNNKFTEIKAGSLGKLDIPMGTLNRGKKRTMPQRRTNRSMSGMDLLKKATKGHR